MAFDGRNAEGGMSAGKIFPSVESAAVFYAEQARLLAADPEQAEVYRTALETAEMLLRLHDLETPAEGKKA